MDLRFIDPRSITEQMKGKEGDFVKLLDAAREIRKRYHRQKEHTAELQRLAAEARKVESGSPEHERIKRKARNMSTQVTDFGDPIEQLVEALDKIEEER